MENTKILVIATSDLARSFNISILRAEDFLAEGAMNELEADDKLGKIDFDMILIDSINTSNLNIVNFVDKIRGNNIKSLVVVLVNGGENSPLGQELTGKVNMKILPLMPPRKVPNKLRELI